MWRFAFIPIRLPRYTVKGFGDDIQANLRLIDVGFRTENLVLMHLLYRANPMNGTRAASLAGIGVFSGHMMSIVLKIPGYAPANRMTPLAYFMNVSRGYFRQQPLRQGGANRSQ